MNGVWIECGERHDVARYSEPMGVMTSGMFREPLDPSSRSRCL
jgi:hypothetical protein